VTKHASLEERFWEKVDVRSFHECWEWRGARFFRTRYGLLSKPGDNKKQLLAHRVSALIHFPDFQESAYVCHRCDNPPCVNPLHLYLGDAKTNAADMMQRSRGNGQFPKGNVPHTARKTHCIRGHALGPYVPGRRRQCRECRPYQEANRR
jgi:hypothetical protein